MSALAMCARKRGRGPSLRSGGVCAPPPLRGSYRVPFRFAHVTAGRVGAKARLTLLRPAPGRSHGEGESAHKGSILEKERGRPAPSHPLVVIEGNLPHSNATAKPLRGRKEQPSRALRPEAVARSATLDGARARAGPWPCVAAKTRCLTFLVSEEINSPRRLRR